jgi:hypothetical protein
MLLQSQSVSVWDQVGLTIEVRGAPRDRNIGGLIGLLYYCQYVLVCMACEYVFTTKQLL